MTNNNTSGYLAEDYLHEVNEADNEPIIEQPKFDIKLPPKAKFPKVNSQFKRGTKEYQDALRRMYDRGDLFTTNMFN